MKILIVNTMYSPSKVGGAEISVQSLAEGFHKKGHQVIIVSLFSENKVYQVNGLPVINRKIENIYWPFLDKKQSIIKRILWHYKDSNNNRYDSFFLDLFKKESPDILFTNNLSGFSANVWEIARNEGIKVVHTLRDYYLQCPNSTKFKNNTNCIGQCFECKVLTKRKKTLSNKVDYVFGISRFILNNHFENGYFKGVSNSVVYNGFDLQFRAKTNHTSTIRLGFMGQITPSKGVALLIDCLNEFEGLNWELKIAGNISDNYKKKLREINPSPKIQFLGYMKSSPFFETIDILVVPSLWNEPFGRVIIEAIMNSTPVLGADVGGIPELLSNNPNFLFRPDSLGLKKKLKEIITNPKVLQEFNYNPSFMQQFAIENSVNQYINIFESILAKTNED